MFTHLDLVSKARQKYVPRLVRDQSEISSPEMYSCFDTQVKSERDTRRFQACLFNGHLSIWAKHFHFSAAHTYSNFAVRTFQPATEKVKKSNYRIIPA